uniref:RNA helicase n=1 Tax=Panagrolaimus superbus TaxID=310955 RepID=A0A914XVM2_9BILA
MMRDLLNECSDIITGMEAMEVDDNEYCAATVSNNALTRSGFLNRGDSGPTPTLYNSNIAAMLASVKGFEDSYLDILEDICTKGDQTITEGDLTTDMLRILMIDYQNDCYTATMKFNIFIHLMHIEECLRVINPVIDSQRFVDLKPINRGQMRLEFELDRPLTLNNSMVFFCERNALNGAGSFYSYEGRAFVTPDSRKLAIEFKFLKDQKLDSSSQFMVFEKPYESNFDAWQVMIAAFRAKPYLSRKFFGPFKFDSGDTLESFLQIRNHNRDLMFADQDDFFNGEQKDAIYSMAFQDPRNAFVLFGPPGTGKTTTLVEAIRMIKKTFKPSDTQIFPRFLVCTPSNSAADAFALALLKGNILPTNYIFRAIASRYDTETFEPRLNDIVKKRGELFCMPDTKEELMNYHVIISTIGFCHSMKALGKKFFTHIIIDEAGQCMEPETLIPVAYYGNEDTKIVIAGDPQQLGPVITNNFLCNPSFGAQNSTLLRLAENGAYRTDERLMVQLRNNHRSHEYLVDMISHMFYNNTLRFTRPKDHDSLCYSPILNNSKIPVRFICVYGKEIDTAPSFYNPEEMSVVDQYVKRCLNEHDLNPADIGVVCPYRESVRRMQSQFQKYRGMTVDTVERFQGSERRVIIMTTVRTVSVGFLQEYRRFNTAVTRAKHMLIVVGDARLLIKDPVWKEYAFIITVKLFIYLL